MSIVFPTSFEQSRDNFLGFAKNLSGRWASVRHEATFLTSHPTLSMDMLWAVPAKKQKLLILSTGLHGIEGYVGAAMLKLFIDDYLARLDPQNTGLLLIHAVNPFGMQVRRRYNENNVDLNRNFIKDDKYDPAINPVYDDLSSFLNPNHPIRNLALSDVAFAGRLVTKIINLGITGLREGTLSGQYRQQQGIQFGGVSAQDTTIRMKDVFNKALAEYQQVVHIDLHTGYGQRYQMSMVNSTREQTPTYQLATKFAYPSVVAANPTEFYTTTGDITDYLYWLRDEKYPATGLFATCFEFGTFGDSLPAQIRSLRATILENRQFHYPSSANKIRERIQREYEELFMPSELKWGEKALADCAQGYKGIFSEYGLIQPN